MQIRGLTLTLRELRTEAGICSILLFLRCLQKRPKAPACFCFRNSQQVCRHSAKLSAHDRTKQKDMQKILSRPRMSLSPPRTQRHNRSYSNIDTHPHKLLRILLTQARAQAVLGRRCAYCPKFQKQLWPPYRRRIIQTPYISFMPPEIQSSREYKRKKKCSDCQPERTVA